FTQDRLLTMARAVAVLVVGLLLARLVAGAVMKVVGRRTTQQDAMVVRRLAFSLVMGLVVMAFLNILGLDLGVLLGAAGILTVAVGFASQTSASNLISGLFLIAERPFVVGDVIRIGTVTGEVLSIDLLSIKLRTFDNLFVRVPNEEIIKTQVTNLTHFPIRRFDMKLGVAYKEDLDRVKELLMETARANPLCLIDPEPLFIVEGFGPSSLDFQFSVWAQREKWLEMRNSMHVGVKRALDEAGIEIPFPHVTLYTGSVTEPFPVKVVGGPPQGPPVGLSPGDQ
ncbi:mechanosensitive ion channel family protein, partial [bacterium]|nr:mechanosensitive ion channel family protein [bacterium]